METKRFSLRTVLSVTTGRLLTKSNGPRDNGIGDMYALLGWMTNDSPFTHQLGRFSEGCKPWLLRWFPELASVNVPFLDDMIRIEGDAEQGCEAWIDAVQKLNDCKADYDVPRIPADDHDRKNPIDELVEMRGGTDGIVVVTAD